jgi:hypothetical protein
MNATRKTGPKARFAEIEARLKSRNYNRATRKANRKYLNTYLSERKETESNAVAARKAQAVALIAELNDYKSPAASMTSSNSSAISSPSPSPSPSPKSALYEQVDVKGDGNCFYRSLYRAAKEHENPAMLERVFTILDADKEKMGSEETGQAALRAAIANYYRTKFNARLGPFEMLKSNYGSAQFNGWVREATGRQASIYRNILKYDAKKYGKVEFYKDLAAVIGTNKEYASDIDYMMIADILDAGGVKMVSSKHSPKGAVFDGKPALYIKRLTYDHYNYWRRKAAPAPAKPAPAPAKPAPAPAKPAAPPPKTPAPLKAPSKSSSGSSSNNSSSNESTNVEGEEERQTLLARLEEQMDNHARCLEKCRKLKTEVDTIKAALAKLGKK